MSEDSPKYNQSINKKLVDQITDNDRLSHALEVLGVSNDSPKHHRFNLVSSISLYASANGDDNLEAQCQKLMAVIKVEE